MGREQKHPEHKGKAAALMNSLLDEVVGLWTSEKEPELKAIAEETEISPAKLRKLLITASIRDHETYFSSSTSDAVLKLRREGRSVKEIQEALGLSYTSVQGYLPHTKIIYSLDTLSTEAERIRLCRRRKKAVEELAFHLHLPDASIYLWRCIIAFQDYPFSTPGRGNRAGTRFFYEVSRVSSGGGRHYQGAQAAGLGNEIFITSGGEQLKKSISGSTVGLALKNALAQNGCVTGPKALGIPGAGSYLYPILVRFGVIKTGQGGVFIDIHFPANTIE